MRFLKLPYNFLARLTLANQPAPALARYLPALLVLAGQLLPRSVAAQASATDAARLCIGRPFIDAVTQYYNIAIGLAIISAILMTMLGGYYLVVSAGSAGLVEKGKKTIFNALFGLTLAILSAVFLNFLNPQIFSAQECTQ